MMRTIAILLAIATFPAAKLVNSITAPIRLEVTLTADNLLEGNDNFLSIGQKTTSSHVKLLDLPIGLGNGMYTINAHTGICNGDCWQDASEPIGIVEVRPYRTPYSYFNRNLQLEEYDNRSLSLHYFENGATPTCQHSNFIVAVGVARYKYDDLPEIFAQNQITSSPGDINSNIRNTNRH